MENGPRLHRFIPRFLLLAAVYCYWSLWVVFRAKKNLAAAYMKATAVHYLNEEATIALAYSNLLDIEEEKIETLLDRYAPFKEKKRWTRTHPK